MNETDIALQRLLRSATLEQMSYRELAPPAEAAGVVRAVWSSEPEANAAVVLPDGSTDIIFVGGSVLLVGVMTTARTATSGRAVFGLRLQPWAAHLVTHGPARRFADQTVPLEHVNPRLFDALAMVRSVDELRDAVTDRRWRRSLHRCGDASAEASVIDAVTCLEHQPSTRLMDVMPLWSDRHARRVFVEQVGLSPKAFARIARLQTAMRLSAEHHRLADLAASAGYADQAHFSRDARALSGMTAAALAAFATRHGPTSMT